MLFLKLICCAILLASPSWAKKPHPHPIPPQGNCNQVEHFAGLFEKFFKQVPLYVYPTFTICSNESITEHYHEAMAVWQNASADHICQTMNYRRSRVNPAEMMHDQLAAFWATANCQDCQDRRNETREFFTAFDGLDQCIKQQPVSPCEACGDSYQQVQTMYEKLAKGHKETICFDVEDRMNRTRHRWSAEFNCCKNKQHSMTTFIGTASAFCSVPLLFYAVMYFVTRRKEAVEELVAGATREAVPEAGPSRGNGMVLRADEEDSDDEPISRKRIDEEEEEEDEPKLNNLDRIRENEGPKEGQLLDIVSNSSGSTVDVNLDHSGMKGDEDDDVSILKHNVVEEKNLLD